MPFSLDSSLPQELISHIVQFVEPQSALVPLCQANRKIGRIAIAHLYADVHLKGSYADTGVKHLLPFTFLMWESPSHAKLVRSFSIRDTWSEDAGIPEDDPDPSNPHARRPWPKHDRLEVVLRAKIAEVTDDKEQAQAWYEAIKHGSDEDAVLALLFPALPKLRKLDLSPSPFIEAHHLLDMFQSLGAREKPFQALPRTIEPNSLLPFSCLTDVLTAGYDGKYPSSPTYFGGALHLPCLRRLYGYRIGEESQDKVTPIIAALAPHSSPVECIELRCSKLYSDDLVAILRACEPGVLKTFMYEIGCSWAWVPVQHNKILEGLEPHAAYLEALSLSHEDYYPYQGDEGSDQENPCALSFSHFTALKKLKIAPVFVWGHDGLFGAPNAEGPEEQRREVPDFRAKLWRSLPPALEELWITRVREVGVFGNDGQTAPFVPMHLFPALEEVLHMKQQAFPNLKQLKLEGPLHMLSTSTINIWKFVHLAESHGVACVLVNSSEEYPYQGTSEEASWDWKEDVEWQTCIRNQRFPKRILEWPNKQVIDLHAALEAVFCQNIRPPAKV
jgi:hypothetical protein